jgi:hypothetical protein
LTANGLERLLAKEINRKNPMAIKYTKAIRKVSPRKVRDLAAQKDPRGGAQKKEGQGTGSTKRGGSPLRIKQIHL